jgi:hypothetical protein
VGTMSDSPTYVCRVCAYGVLPAEAAACVLCSSPHHQDCWEFAGGCSTFGCGGTEQVPFTSVEQGLQVADVQVAAEPPARQALAVQGRRILGRLRVEARSLTTTVPAGLVGGAVSLAVGCLLVGITNALAPKPVQVLMGMGLLYGCLAPFLVNFQLRHPRKVLAAGSLLLCAALNWQLYTYRNHAQIILSLVAATTLGSTLSEMAFGRRSRAAELLGPAAVPVRYLATGILSLLSIFLGSYVVVSSINFTGPESLVVSILAALCAGHPLERGKAIVEESYQLPEA